ncbi:MAG: hypothetical protein JWO06_1613, partial [Bacteroidota bacterium]|nr:hypothetical protein [Bacteroidota bacterium]
MPVTAYELTNAQRIYFGLDPIEDHWDRVTLKGDTYRPESILYFDGDVIKRHIVSTVDKYSENQYNEPTNDRNAFPPKTAKGKETKLSATALEKKKELGVYLSVNEGVLIIGNYDTQTTFYSSYWENGERSTKTAAQRISDFIANSPEDHLQKMNEFKNSKKKNIKYRSGDYFCFKLDRTNFGFGRLLLDVNKVRKQGLVS